MTVRHTNRRDHRQTKSTSAFSKTPDVSRAVGDYLNLKIGPDIYVRRLNITLLQRRIRRSLTVPSTAEIYGNVVATNVKRSCRLLHQNSEAGVFDSEPV